MIAEEEFLRNQVLCIREMASKADPFIKRRLLDLADNYERRLSKPPRSLLKLPSVEIAQNKQD